MRRISTKERKLSLDFHTIDLEPYELRYGIFDIVLTTEFGLEISPGLAQAPTFVLVHGV